MGKYFFAILAVFFIFAQPLSLRAQHIARTETGKSAATAAARYNYLFENPRFTTPVQEVGFDDDGKGEFRFKKKDQDEIVLKLNLSPELLSHVRTLFNELNFINSDEDYQHKKDFSHLGVMTITQIRDGKERVVKVNYTDNQPLNRLIEIFRNIATQETRIFELETVRTNDPISTPAQLRLLETELKGKHIADPVRLTPILQDIKLDEAVPLIARNHAERLLQYIQKNKSK